MAEPVKEFLPFVNNVRGDLTLDEIIKTANDGANLLEPHCGPNATFVARAVCGNSLTLDEFTKDGITILKSSETDRPVHEFVRRLLVFVGESVDRVCHDGTTTAMMFTSALISEYLTLVRGMDRRERRRMSIEMEKMFRDLLHFINQDKFTVESLTVHLNEIGIKMDQEAVKMVVAYWTAYTSTKGDREYAQAITDSVMSYPKELYSYGRVGQMNIEEKDVHVKLSGDESDITLSARSAINEMKGNDKLRIDWKYDDALFSIYERTLTPGDHVSDFLVNWVSYRLNPEQFEGKTIPPYPEVKKPYVIFVPKVADSRLLGLVRLFNSKDENQDKPIILMELLGYDDEAARAFAMALPTICGKGQYKGLDELNHGSIFEDCVIPCTFSTLGNDCYLSDLYMKGKGPEHPFLYDKTKEGYHDALRTLQKFIANDRKRHLKVQEGTVNQFHYLIQHMLAQDVRNVMSCGTSHEVVAGRSVLEDGLGATLSVLENGFTLSGYVKLYDALRRSYEEKRKALDPDYDLDPTYEAIYQATCRALRRVIAATYTIKQDEVDTLLPLGYLSRYETAVEDIDDIIVRRDITKDVTNHLWKDTAVAVQPIVGFEEQIRRNMDLVIKLVRTNTVVLMKG